MDLISDLKEAKSLKDIFKFFCSSHPQIKKFWKKKSKSLEEDYNLEKVVKEQAQNKKETKLLNKKKQRQEESEENESEDEEVVKPKKKPQDVATPIAKNTKSEITNNGINGTGTKIPFKRIDDSLKDALPENLQDNSYDKFMNRTGENYGKLAHEKLKLTKGKGFKKEKTKFKNKTAFGGTSISTEVRSIPLDSDSD
jgi:hypothetical protein